MALKGLEIESFTEMKAQFWSTAYLQGKGILHFCEIAPVVKEEETVDLLFLRGRKQAPNQARLA